MLGLWFSRIFLSLGSFGLASIVTCSTLPLVRTQSDTTERAGRSTQGVFLSQELMATLAVHDFSLPGIQMCFVFED